jgi:hypothetical protein
MQTANRTAIAQELESTRADFRHLLASIPPSVWHQRGPGSAWTVREELWHIAWGNRFMLDLIKNARRGIGLPKPPMVVADRLNALYTRLRTARATPSSIAARYDRVHHAALRQLDAIRDDEWERSVLVFGHRQTVAELFHGITHHFEEHANRIRPLLAPDDPR